MGSSIDILPAKEFDAVYSAPIIKESLSAGWGPITYRQNTELTIEAWHWNPDGTWSDPQTKSGYFVGNAEPAGSLNESFGFKLPHRGSTRSDEDSDEYSRITDGNPGSYWKQSVPHRKVYRRSRHPAPAVAGHRLFYAPSHQRD